MIDIEEDIYYANWLHDSGGRDKHELPQLLPAGELGKPPVEFSPKV